MPLALFKGVAGRELKAGDNFRLLGRMRNVVHKTAAGTLGEKHTECATESEDQTENV